MVLKADAILNVVVVVVVVVVVLVVVVVVVGVSLGSTCFLRHVCSERHSNIVQVQSCVKNTHGHASVL